MKYIGGNSRHIQGDQNEQDAVAYSIPKASNRQGQDNAIPTDVLQIAPSHMAGSLSQVFCIEAFASA